VSSPRIGVGGRQDHTVGVGPVVVQAFPNAPRAFGDVGLVGALAMHLEVVVGAIREQLRAARSEVGEPGDELFRPCGGRLVEMDGGHVVLLDWTSLLPVPVLLGSHALSRPWKTLVGQVEGPGRRPTAACSAASPDSGPPNSASVIGTRGSRRSAA
jgi:hypothetical protein